MYRVWYVCISLALVLSVLIGRNFQVNSEYFYVAAAALAPCLIAIRRNRKLFAIITLGVISMVLIARSAQTQPPPDINPSLFSHGERTIIGTVASAPRVTAKSTQVVLNEVTISMSDNVVGQKWFGSIAVTLPRYIDIRYGDTIQAKAQLQPLSEVKDEGYREYLKNHNIYGTLIWPQVTILSRGNGNKLVSLGIDIQTYLNNQYQKVLPKDAAAFLSGVVLGSKQELSEDFEQALKVTGTTHIIVASGYNISVLIGVLLKIFGQLRKINLTLIVIVTLVCFVVISGLDASVIRASIMATLVLFATVLGRQHQALYCLLITAILMLIVNPLWLLDTSFQLSFLATTGIILLQPTIIKHLAGLPGWASDSLSTTVAAQALVFPILVATFGKISVVSVLTNVLVLWVTPWLMFGGIALLCIMLISHALGGVIAFIVYPVFWYIKKVIMLTSMVPFAILPLKLPWTSAVAYYLLILAIQWRNARHSEI